MTARGGTDKAGPKGRAKASGNRGGGKPPVDSKTRARVRKLAREGMTRNAIARAVGIDGSTVTRICAEARPPITFDRSATKAAVEARTVDLKAQRQTFAADLITEAQKMLGRIIEPLPRTAWSVTTGVVSYEAPATPNEMKDLAIALGILADKHLVMVRADTDDRDLNAVDAWLESRGQGAPAEVWA